MNNISKISIIATLLVLFSFSMYAKDNAEELQAPKNGKIISQSCTQYDLFITMIDLENNEVVILQYSASAPKAKLIHIIRTGIIVDPKSQAMIQGTDCPFETEKNS